MAKILPFIATRGIVVLPYTQIKIEIGRQKSIEALEYAIENKTDIIITTQLDPDLDEPKFKDISKYATIAQIVKARKNKDGDYNITLLGTKIVKLEGHDNDDELSTMAKYSEIDEKWELDKEQLEDVQTLVMEAIQKDIPFKKEYFEKASQVPMNEKLSENDFLSLINNLFMAFNYNDFNNILNFISTNDSAKKIEIFADSILRKMPDDKIQSNVDATISKKMNENLSKQQREFYLRERLRVIREELKQISTRDDEIELIKARLEKEPFPENIKKKITRELNKYEQANPNETSIVKSYIDWLMSLPWWEVSEDNNDLKNVSSVLDKNHYGIRKVKERIVEYLAVKLQNPDSKGAIICLVGPPGVGKTSLAKSIAEALNKKFVKISLGGVKDESEIRGHRKTYLGAMPGRIIKGMRNAGVKNPLFLLDEIDKMSSDYKGDPSSALLEVLDPEQNTNFSDNYIEEEYDLSKVMFVATANYYNQIPEALIDRLEVIDLSSYTPNEKLEIAKSHLIKKVLNSVNLTTDNIKFTDEGINFIINHYTREAGVRELQRVIDKIVRKYLVQKMKGEINSDQQIVVDAAKAREYLGKEIFDLTIKDDYNIPGVVNGMAYTSAGGDLLPIEATYFKGKGNIIITGNLEKTMNESVNVALGYVKANAVKFGIDPEVFKTNDIHVHVPAGGIPKDGPSAGVALTSALISVLTNTPVSTKISMTGEIMLRGKVGIIGGVKEKVISAYRAGVREIFLPKDDERFLEDIPNEILSEIKIHLVQTYDEIFSEIFKDVKINDQFNKDSITLSN